MRGRLLLKFTHCQHGRFGRGVTFPPELVGLLPALVGLLHERLPLLLQFVQAGLLCLYLVKEHFKLGVLRRDLRVKGLSGFVEVRLFRLDRLFRLHYFRVLLKRALFLFHLLGQLVEFPLQLPEPLLRGRLRGRLFREGGRWARGADQERDASHGRRDSHVLLL